MLDQQQHQNVSELAGLNWPLIKKLNFSQQLDHKEIVSLRKLHEQTLVIEKHQDFLSQKNIRNQFIVINQGWACRYSVLSNGNRQLINFYLPGDIINPYTIAATNGTHSIFSITSLYISPFNQEALQQLLTLSPKLDSLYKQMICAEEAMLAEHVVRVGRRSAYQRTIHLLLELYQRLDIIGHTQQNTFNLPLTQELLADMLGMSIVHMNRTLHRLRDEDLIETQSNKISLLDIPKLEQLAEYQGILLDTELAAQG